MVHVGSGGRQCLSGRYEASGGVWCSRLAKEGGLNGKRNNWGLGYSEGFR
jgi:hypothetical protein